MIPRFRNTRLLLCWLIFPLQAIGLPVAGLYSHEVAVSSQSEGERNRAFQEALSAVLLKVTGEKRWLENSSLRQALENAQNYVEAINPRTETLQVTVPEVEPVDIGVSPDIPGTTEVQQEYINVVFARDLIDKLLANAAIPVWDSNRPSVLVWMVLQNDAGERSLLSTETNPEIIRLMQQFAGERGLPVIFPLLDFEDQRNLSADKVWSLDEDAIRQSSLRYGADSILTGRLHLTSSGDLVGLWQFIFQDQVDVFDSLDTDLQNYIYQPLDRITNQLARHFSIVASLNGNQKVRLRVAGIRDLSAYSDLLNYLQSLVLVEHIGISQLQGENLELELTLQGEQQQLYELIALDRDLLLLEGQSPENSAILSFRWTR
ncbi:MAG: DUF2066 domain-containing protein [Gammaproteobacteria bacterium]|nr:DUF2066 domain-containing protein [Gammaproteobacteria bacterium]